MKTIMKIKSVKRLLACLLMSIATFSLYAQSQQNLQDVVYLKNGSIIHGIIIEQVPGKTIKIQTADQNVFVYEMDEIEKLTREPLPESQTGKQTNKTSKTKAVPQELKRFSVLVNPLGFLQFGPYIQGEIRFLPNTVFSPHIRFAGMGVLTHAVSDYEDLWVSSMAIGFGIKHFFELQNSSNRVYLGAYFEEGWTQGEASTYDSWELIPHHCQYNTFTMNLGYRWRYSKFYLNIGGLGGLAVETWDGNEDDGAIYPNDAYLIGMLEVSIGMEF